MNCCKTFYRYILYLLVTGLLACSSGNNSGNSTSDNTESGLQGRPSNTSCIAPQQGPDSSPALLLQPAFPDLAAMGDLVALRQAPGDISQWYAAVKDGRILVFDNTENVTNSTEFINIQSQVINNGEQGLLGMAFHPDYDTNGEIYLYYSTNTPSRRSNISRFTFTNGSWQETIVLSILQPYANHNGGNILFGPNDGYLYIGLGDGGNGGDPDGNGQDRSTLLGSLLRIDVDGAAPYAIPVDNPYAGNPLCDNPDIVENAQFCPEVYAYGLRNPWRWSFDRLTGELWLGDVGQNRVEEIDIINNGENYGWPVMEGSECYNTSSTTCNSSGDYTLPVAEYNHGSGNASVVGGYVYRGNDPELAFLYGSYLFADTYSSEISRTTWNGTDYVTESLFNAGMGIFSFAESLGGEVFVLSPNGSGSGSNIYRFAPDTNPGTGSEIPAALSESGCFASTSPLTPAAGVIPYDVIVPLWSDGAVKKRYMSIPDGTHIELDADGDFIFPVGSVLIKHFLVNNRPVETRLLMRHSDRWGGYSYEWQYDNDGNPIDAQLLMDSKSKDFEGQNWYYPSRNECFNCHTNAANISLGLETLQLNRRFTYPSTGKTAHQLDTLEAINILSIPVSSDLRNLHLAALDDVNYSYDTRAKSYLHANCAQCHQPDAATPTTMDLRFVTPLAEMNICDIDPQEGDLGITGLKLLDPSGSFNSPNSAIVTRMASLDDTIRMPPLATELVDTSAVSVIKHWVDELASCH